MSEYAHRVAPDIDGHRFIGDGDDPTGAAATKAAYQAARAWGFMKGWEQSGLRWSAGLSQALAAYELAALYWHCCTTDLPDIDTIAAYIASDLASPHVIAPNILTMLEWAGIDPAEIKPYSEETRSHPEVSRG